MNVSNTRSQQVESSGVKIVYLEQGCDERWTCQHAGVHISGLSSQAFNFACVCNVTLAAIGSAIRNLNSNAIQVAQVSQCLCLLQVDLMLMMAHVDQLSNQKVCSVHHVRFGLHPGHGRDVEVLQYMVVPRQAALAAQTKDGNCVKVDGKSCGIKGDQHNLTARTSTVICSTMAARTP